MVLKEMREITKSQDHLSDTHDNMLDELKSINSNQKAMKKDISDLTCNQKKLTSEMDELKMRLNKLEHEKMDSGVIIRGVDEFHSETALQVLRKVTEALEVRIENFDEGVKAQWIKTQHKNEEVRHIRAELKSKETIKNMVKLAKQKRIDTGAIGGTGEGKPIFVDEIMTQHTRKLFLEARRLREYGYKFIWVSGSSVLIREKEGAKVIEVKSIEHIDNMKKRGKREENGTKSRASTDRSRQYKHNNRSNSRNDRLADSKEKRGRDRDRERDRARSLEERDSSNASYSSTY